jgi:hypothetical protein
MRARTSSSFFGSSKVRCLSIKGSLDFTKIRRWSRAI